MPVRGNVGEARGAAMGGAVVCCHCWRAVWGFGGCVRPPTCASSGPRGGGAPLAERRGDAGVRARGASPSLPPMLSRRDAIGRGVVCCHWRAMGGLGRGA